MIAEAGHFALTLALFVSIVQATIPMIGAQRGSALWMAMDRPSAISQFLLIAFSFALLFFLLLFQFFLKIVCLFLVIWSLLL